MRVGVPLVLVAVGGVACTSLAGIADYDEVETPPPLDGVRDLADDAGVDEAADAANAEGGVSFVSAASDVTPAGTTITISLDAAPTENDFVWLVVYTDHVDTIVDAPGWTLEQDRRSTASDFHSWWYWRWARSGAPRSYTVTASAPTLMAGAIAVYRGVDQAAPIDAYASADTSKSPYLSPPLSTKRARTRIVASFILDSAGPATWHDPPKGTARAKNAQLLLVDFEASGEVAPLAAGSSVDDVGMSGVVALAPQL